MLATHKRLFSFIHNFHSPPYFYVNGIRYIQDYDLEEYEPSVQAFLTKRWTCKREVPAKIAIIDGLDQTYSQVFYQQRLAPGDQLYEAKHMERLYDSDQVNTQFMHALVCEDYEKNMIDEVLQHRVMNGSVPSSLDLPIIKRVNEEAQKWVDVFYKGDQLTEFEHDLQKIYLAGKMTKYGKYEKRRIYRFKVSWTVSDLNLIQLQANYRMRADEYFGTPRPLFNPYDLDAALRCMYIHQDIHQSGYARRALTWLSDAKIMERGLKRSKLQAHQLMTRFLLYQDCREFVDALQLKDDFHIHNSIANMHVWLLYQRLRDFAENKFAFQLREELVDAFNNMINEEMEDVQVLRKMKKIEDIDNYLFAIRRNLDFHFYINGATTKQPEYKLDALVWTCIFHEKVPRYSPQVYIMSQYLLKHYQYLKTVDYTDIERGMVEWSVNRIPFNPREQFTRLPVNRPLSIEEYEKERDSPYKTKKYHYNYRNPDELSPENLTQTFINLTSTALIQNKDKTVKQDNLNLDGMNSKEREEAMYKMKLQLEKLAELPDENDSFFKSIKSGNALHSQFSIWKKNLFIPLTDQLEEQAERKVKERDEKKFIKENEGQAFFVAPGQEKLFDIEAQRKKNERHQAILRQTIAQEKGVDPAEIDFVQPDYEKRESFQDTVDKLPVKRKQKWRLW